MRAGLPLDDFGRAQHLALASGQAEPGECVGAQARDRLLEQSPSYPAGIFCPGDVPWG